MWSPRHTHVSQLHPDGDGGLSGWNDCWEACLARYLRERDAAVTAGDDWALIDAVGRAARGTPDGPDNPDTSLGEAGLSLRTYGIPVRWTTSYGDALAAPWAICLVDGRVLAPSLYPPEWFSPDPGPNHFILWLPYWQGSADWFDDPLAYANGQQDCRYGLGSVAAAFSGAYLLPESGHGELLPEYLRVIAGCALKLMPNHECIALARLHPGDRVRALEGRIGEWRQVRTAAGLSGWVPERDVGR